MGVSEFVFGCALGVRLCLSASNRSMICACGSAGKTANRPVVLVRYPDGIEGKSFYQWHVPRGTPEWLRSLEQRDEEASGRK